MVNFYYNFSGSVAVIKVGQPTLYFPACSIHKEKEERTVFSYGENWERNQTGNRLNEEFIFICGDRLLGL